MKAFLKKHALMITTVIVVALGGTSVGIKLEQMQPSHEHEEFLIKCETCVEEHDHTILRTDCEVCVQGLVGTIAAVHSQLEAKK